MILQVTQAYTKVGINPVSGLVYFLHRQSPEDAATEHWGRKPTGEELPALRSSSDITWGSKSNFPTWKIPILTVSQCGTASLPAQKT